MRELLNAINGRAMNDPQGVARELEKVSMPELKPSSSDQLIIERARADFETQKKNGQFYSDMSAFQEHAYAQSLGGKQDGRALSHVLGWMSRAPYNVDSSRIPSEAQQSAAAFDKWLSDPANAASIGLWKAEQNDPKQVTQGAIVITKPGAGSHPVHGNIGVATIQFSGSGGSKTQLANGGLLPTPTPDQVSSIYLPAYEPVSSPMWSGLREIRGEYIQPH